MHENAVFNHFRHLKEFFKGLNSGGQEMHRNTFLTTPGVRKYLFKDLILVIWKYAQMHQNTFLTTPDVKKYLF